MPAPIRDAALLDALERLPQRPYGARVWRSVAAGRSPTECWRAGGRWDDRTFDVLYTSETRDGAIAERRFHLYMGQPLPPSKLQYELYELKAVLERAITFSDLEALRAVGLETSRYGRAAYAGKDGEYPQSQAVAEACFFLGADGIVVPNARHDSRNLIVFCEQETEMVVSVMKNHGVIEWG